MAAKPVEFHEDADAEYDHALGWYLERSQSAASDFADELNRAVEMIADAPRSVGVRRVRHAQVSSSSFSVCSDLPRTPVGHSGTGCSSSSSAPRLSEGHLGGFPGER